MKKRVLVFLVCLLASHSVWAEPSSKTLIAKCKAHATLTSRVLQLSQAGVPMHYVFQALNLSMATFTEHHFAVEMMSLYNIPIQKDPKARKQLIRTAAKAAMNECMVKRT